MPINNRILEFLQPNGAMPTEDTRTSLEKKQDTLRSFVRMIAQRKANALLCVGAGGNGKSTIVHEVLAEHEHGIKLIVANSHLTPMGCLELLWVCRAAGNVILIEDAEQSLTGATIGLLRSATEGVNGRRIVTYTTSQKLNAPSWFVFEGQIIICANSIPKDRIFDALVSRCLTYRLDPSREEILEQFRKEVLCGYESPSGRFIDPVYCNSIVSHVERNATCTLSMRHFKKIFQTVAFALDENIPWEDLLNSQLESLTSSTAVTSSSVLRQHDLDCLKEAMQRHPNSSEKQLKVFKEETGKSRATFFRLKKLLGNNNGNGLI